jgi:hypothetical protein
MRHLSHGLQSNSLHLERKIALALMIPRIWKGKGKHMERRKGDNETKANNCLGTADGREKDVSGGMTNGNEELRI